ncbi:sulfate transport system permease protein CysW [Abditibacteriota bacterium]|nr:sulfate transport system permease protein CysW [Abditibacteriota bacterium]
MKTLVVTSPVPVSPTQSQATTRDAKRAATRATSEPRLLQWFLIALAVGTMGLILVVPLFVVFSEAFSKGLELYKASIVNAEAMSAIKLTLLVAFVAVPINTVFGVAAAWAITRFQFKGKGALITLIDLPFAVSPVISGLIFVLMFGRRGIFGPFLQAHDWKIIFALPGIILATLFVTFPFVARQLIAFMESQGAEEEEAAVTLGANGFQTFWRITLPNIKWALLTGIILCNARAMGEFGAVSVVSGHVRGQTNTIPLQVEILYNEYQYTASFAVASLLTFLGLITLGIKTALEWKTARQLKEGQT